MNETRDWQAMKVMSERLLKERTGADLDCVEKTHGSE